MIKWFKRLFRKEVVFVPSKPVQPWTDEARKGLNEFLSTKLGKLLLEHMEGAELACASWVCKPGANDREYRSGVAYGRFITRQQLLLLAMPKNEQEEEGLFLDGQSPSESEIEEIINNRVNRLAKDDHLIL